MIRLFDKVLALSIDSGFLHFQHDLARRMYDALGQGYAANDNEVSLIKRVVDAVNGQSYKGIRMFSTVIHGTRSYVEFNFMDKPVTKELGDMTIITLVTDKSDRLLQKVCVIQNKKERDGHWDIDAEQLYLLKNFPPFSGNKGIFRRCNDMSFRNSSGALGCFGLLFSPGEMILASAPALTEMLRGKKSVSHSDIGVYPGMMGVCLNGSTQATSFWLGFPWRYPKEFFMFFEKFVGHYGYPFVTDGPFNGFLGCTQFARDIHDFTRNWTQFNIGEPTSTFGSILNPAVDAFGNFVVRSAGFKDLNVELPTGRFFGDQEFEGQMAVLLMHVDVSRDK